LKSRTKDKPLYNVLTARSMDTPNHIVPPRYVRCAVIHSTSACTKTKDEPLTYTLCGGNHMANYLGCLVYKDLQRLYYGKNIPNKKYNLRKDVNYSSIVNKEEDSGEKNQSKSTQYKRYHIFTKPKLTTFPFHHTNKNTP